MPTDVSAVVEPEVDADKPSDGIASFTRGITERAKAASKPASAKSEQTPIVAPAKAEPEKAVAKDKESTPKKEAAPTGEPEKKPDDELSQKLKERDRAISRIGNENKELKRELDIMKAKIEGTYEEPVKPSPDDEKALADFQGRERADMRAAVGMYGAEVIQDSLYADNNPYLQLIKDEPWWHQRVMSSPNPVQEAMTILSERRLVKELGSDLDKAKTKLAEEMKPKLLEEITSKERVVTTGKTPPSLSSVRTAGNETEKGRGSLSRFSVSKLNPHNSL